MRDYNEAMKLSLKVELDLWEMPSLNDLVSFADFDGYVSYFAGQVLCLGVAG